MKVFPTMSLPNSPREALRIVGEYLRSVHSDRHHAVSAGTEVLGFWQTTEWIEGLRELGEEAFRVSGAMVPNSMRCPYCERIRVSEVSDSNDELRALLRVANCPNCDGSGAIPLTHRAFTGEIDHEAMPCRWCDERKRFGAAPTI